jgi:hypothetical protein
MQHTILYSETILDIFEHTLKHSNQAEHIYLTYSWFGFKKQYIYFSVSRISPSMTRPCKY